MQIMRGTSPHLRRLWLLFTSDGRRAATRLTSLRLPTGLGLVGLAHRDHGVGISQSADPGGVAKDCRDGVPYPLPEITSRWCVVT